MELKIIKTGPSPQRSKKKRRTKTFVLAAKKSSGLGRQATFLNYLHTAGRTASQSELIGSEVLPCWRG